MTAVVRTVTRSLPKALALSVALTVSAIGTHAVAQESPTAHLNADGSQLAQIETPEQAVAFANVQNLAARWNNMIGSAKTGDELRSIMMESGVFADDIVIDFLQPDGSRLVMDGLKSAEAQQFYGGFLEGLKAPRHNAVANVEVLRFTEGGAEARFRWFVFMNERYSLGGVVQATVANVDGRMRFTKLTLNAQRLDVAHAY